MDSCAIGCMSEATEKDAERTLRIASEVRRRIATGELTLQQRHAAEDRLARFEAATRPEDDLPDEGQARDSHAGLDTAATLEARSAASIVAGTNNDDVVVEIPMVTGDAAKTLEPTPPPGRRWTCLQEAPSTKSARIKFWNGCGMETHAIVGRRIDVEGLGTGKCVNTRQARLVGGFLHQIVFDSGLTKEIKLLHGGLECAGASGDVGFTVEDEQPSDQPWRWSDDPRSPSPQPGEAGNLTPAQTAAVGSFRELANANDVEETVVIRYLRASNFDVELASDQWSATLSWRKVQDVDSLMHTQDPPKVCDSPLLLQGLYPHIMAGYDRGGRPVRVECMGRVNAKEMYRFTTEEAVMRYHIWQNEEIQHRFLPAASQRTGHVQTQVTVVLDMTNAKLGNLTTAEARDHIKNFVQVTSDFYPEILNKMVIVNAPRLLSMAWDFVAPLLDAGTKRKITIAPPGTRTRSLLHTIIHPSQVRPYELFLRMNHSQLQRSDLPGTALSDSCRCFLAASSRPRWITYCHSSMAVAVLMTLIPCRQNGMDTGGCQQLNLPSLMHLQTSLVAMAFQGWAGTQTVTMPWTK